MISWKTGNVKLYRQAGAGGPVAFAAERKQWLKLRKDQLEIVNI
jgi:hypothetical protein